MFESFHGDEDPPGDLYPERRSPWGLIGDSDFDGDIRGGILVESSKRPLFDAFFFFNEDGRCFVEVQIFFNKI